VRSSKRAAALTTSLTATVLSIAGFISISKNSNIRAVEIVSLLACGMSIGAFLVTLVLSIKMKKAID
jgi:Na+/melibiose symporter-like transporter